MVKRLISVYTGLLIIILIGTLFGFIPRSHAQSIQNWSDPINLSMSGAASNPSIVVDSKGILHVIWVDEFDGYKYTASADGVEWIPPQAVTFPFSPEHSPPKFEVTADGIIHVFWIDDQNMLYYSQTQQANFGSPSSWRSTFRLGDFVIGYDTAVSGAGSLHVTFIKNDGLADEPAGIYYRRLVIGESSWSGAQKIFESPYFRSLTVEDANIGVSISHLAEKENIYAVWDSRYHKRIFMAKSEDDGETWNAAQPIVGPEESSGYQTPYKANIHTFGEMILLLWRVGESNNQCSQYSQSSINQGRDWGAPIKIIDENLGCPEKIDFFTLNQNLSLLLLNIQGGLSLVAWNGSEWSDFQLQTELLNLSNPTMFDSILLGCQQYSIYEDRLYLVGCEQGTNGDIWFTSRLLDSVEAWYPASSSWSPTGSLTSTEQTISSLSSIAYLDSVHVFWVQSPRSSVEEYAPSIHYSRWDGEKWLNPRAVISNLTGNPLQISVTKDWQGRLLLTWIEDGDGGLFFSWANSEGAGYTAEWIQPKLVPSISQLVSSPEILVDASGRIVIAYAITMNEGRGIYIVQSTDLGNTWSSPQLVYDAVTAGWEIIDRPKISLSEDGRLHLLFHRYSRWNDDESIGLFYIQSTDGGRTWSDPETMREGLIVWSDIYSYDQQSVHRIWQEKDGVEVSYIDQLSLDGGLTWEAPVKIIGANEATTQVAVALDEAGNLYLAQLTYGEETSLKDWRWDGSRWILLESKELNLEKDSTLYSISNSISSNGNVVVPIVFEYADPTGKNVDEIISFHRAIEVAENTQDLVLPIIPTHSPQLISTTTTVDIPPTPITEVSPLTNLNTSPPTIGKDAVGIILVTSILILIALLARTRKKTDKEHFNE